MIVRLRAFGELERLFGGERPHLTLPDDATLGCLLDAIDERWGTRLDAAWWDRATRRFRGPVVILVDGSDVHDPATRLDDGQEVLLVPIVSGGQQ
jgi:molybdopterin converting factor small subunit